MWKWALLSAFFAALTAILAKAGVAGISSNLATAVRTAVILVITWGIVLLSGDAGAQLRKLGAANWWLLVFSGAATGLSWLCYFKALQLGEASKVAPIDKLSVVFVIALGALLLHEKLSWPVVAGGGLIAAGSLIIAISSK